MRLRIKHSVFAMLILNVLVGANLWAANSAHTVDVDGDRISVHAEGMSLGELLMVVEDKAGVQFRFDELVTTKEVFLDFEGLPLSEGVRHIIHPLSWAMIYDVTGKLRKVIILERWKGSGMDIPRRGRNGPLEGSKREPLDSVLFAPKGSSESFRPSKGPSLGKRPVYPDDSPVDKAHSRGKLPTTQNEMPERLPVPSVAGSLHLPIPDSKGAPVEVPPVGKADSGGTPPDSQDEIPENLPVPGVASSEHLPIPGS